MKANELRIGNWVYDEFKKKEIQTNGSFLFVPEILKPILLTDEWLVKFGFNKTFENPFQEYEWQFKYFTLDQKMCPYLGRYSDETPFNSVHQLQNLYFALTGEELELKQA